MYDYRVYDLIFASELKMPEWKDVSIQYPTQLHVTIELGIVPKQLAGARKSGVCYQLGKGSLQLNVPGVARYLARNGNEIVVDPEPDASEDAVRAFLLDAPLCGILHQRGALPFYAAAVEVDEQAVMIAGISGTGKSTVARGLMHRGYKLISDDLTVVADRGGWLMVLGGYPCQRLPMDVLQREGLDPQAFTCMRQGIVQRRVPVLPEQWSGNTRPLKKIYLVTTWNKPDIELKALEEGNLKFNLLHDAMHRQYLSGMGGGFSLVKITAQLLNKMPAVQVIHGRSREGIEGCVDLVEENLKS